MALLLVWQERPEDPAIQADIRRFCAQDSEHRMAWEEAKRVFRLSGEAFGAQEKRRRRRISRRQAVLGFGAVAALGAGALMGPRLWRGWSADFSTQVAEMRTIPLSDGTILTLGPSTSVAMAFTASERRISLLDGMVMCDVAKDAARPFVVATMGLTATALGTRFEVTRNGSLSAAGVEEGQIRVAVEGGADEVAQLSAGDWLSVEPDTGKIRRGRNTPNQTASWRQSLLIADEEKIGDVVAQIARWRQGRVLIADPWLAALPVSGLFNIKDTDAALEAVIKPYGGKVRHISPWLTIVSRL